MFSTYSTGVGTRYPTTEYTTTYTTLYTSYSHTSNWFSVEQSIWEDLRKTEASTIKVECDIIDF